MKRRIGTAMVGLAAVVATAGALAPSASAAPLQPQRQEAGAFGSVSICTGIPIGPVTISVCI